MTENCKNGGFAAPPYGSTRFSLRENYKCSLWNLPLQSLKPSHGPALVAMWSLYLSCFYLFHNSHTYVADTSLTQPETFGELPRGTCHLLL